MSVAQKGPANPISLDPGYRPEHNHGTHFKNDLTWISPWGPDPTVRQFSEMERLAGIATAELQNASDALPAVCADSRLADANSGNNDQEGVPPAGVSSAGSIQKKIAQLALLLPQDVPDYRRKHGLAGHQINSQEFFK